MPQILLTDISVRSLAAPKTGQITYWDNKMPGFGCRISQGGQKTFVVMYGPREARRRKVVGKYPLQSLKVAREQARKTLAQLALGIAEEKATPAISFTDARMRFLEQSARRNKPRTTSDYKRLLTRHFTWRGKELRAIGRLDIQRSLDKLETTPSEYQHAYVAIRVFFNWAYKEELIDTNPADRLQKPLRTASRERVLEGPEIKAVFQSALTHEWPYGPIVALCLLTGQRRGEIAMLEWDWVNTTERTITLPGQHVKNSRTHLFPYGDLTAKVLSSIPQIDRYLFSGRTKSNAIFNGWGKAKADFDAGLENIAPYTLHDLRRTFSTTHAKLGTPIHVTEKFLNHMSGSVSGVAAIYNRHSYVEEMRKAACQYETYLSQIIHS